MKRLVLRWIAMLVFVVALAALFVRLGEWQLHRHDAKVDAIAHIQANERGPVRDYRDVMGSPVNTDQEWTRVSVSGTFDASNQIIVRYRNNDGRPGAEIVTPLRTTHGDWVVVNRGFIVRGSGELDPEVPPAPTGEVQITGYLRADELGKDTSIVPVEGRVKAINAAGIGGVIGKQVLPGYISVVEITPAQQGPFEVLALPTLDEGPHMSYAIQWFAFTVIALGGFAILIRGDLRDRRKRLALEARRAAAAEAEAVAP